MRQNYKLILLVLVISLTGTIQASFKSLSAVSALSKGYAITADHIGLEALYKNPAGLDNLTQTTISNTYGSFFDNYLQASSFGIGLPLFDNFTLGIMIPIYKVGNILKTVETSGHGVQTDTFEDLQGAAIVGISGTFLNPSFHLGFSGSYYTHQLDTHHSTGFGLDAGIIVDTNFGTIGASVQDIGGTKLHWDTQTTELLPQITHIGITLNLPILDKLLTDASFEKNKNTSYSIGIEKHLAKEFSLLAGANHLEEKAEFTLGAQLTIDNIQLNYAYSEHEELGTCHKMGLQFQL
ncbi:MAG: hypothetical protein EXS67_05895 [Candidatus Margulisbacteria bacterium]|nr:hypothetical protein [Candidatus Margulisiibacteriota bacterium]